MNKLLLKNAAKAIIAFLSLTPVVAAKTNGALLCADSSMSQGPAGPVESRGPKRERRIVPVVNVNVYNGFLLYDITCSYNALTILVQNPSDETLYAESFVDSENMSGMIELEDHELHGYRVLFYLDGDLYEFPLSIE